MRVLRSLLLASATVCVAQAFSAEFIFENAPFTSCHASTIVETAPGEFLAAWFGGTSEGSPDVAIWGSRRDGNGWSPPFELAREHQIATYNPVLFYSADHTLWLYYKFGPKPSEWSAARKWSRDNGNTWSPVEYLPAGLYGPIKNKPLVLKNGIIVSGTSVESYHAWASWVERSVDGGKTWTKHGPILYPGDIYASIQPAIVILRDGRLRMFVRTTGHIGRICFSDSTDGGITWTPLAKTTLLNPNSGIDATTLRDGRVMMVYNDSSEQRTPLRLALSEDGGNWKQLLSLETEPGEFSYPAVIQASDGAVHVTYTWNRKRIRHVRIAPSEIP